MDQETRDDRVKLLDSARAMLARGNSKFSIAMLCAEAGVSRDVFRTHFSGKADLLAAVMAPEPAPEAPVAAPDAWLERRLRVFERALTALESRAEATARDHARAIAALEERLTALGAPQPAPAVVETDAEEDEAPQPAAQTSGEARADLVLPPLEPAPMVVPSRAEMAEVLEAARGKTRIVPDEPPPKNNARLRWLTVGVLCMAALFLCVGLTLGDTARATSADLSGSATSHRMTAPSGLARTIALADAGDARARTALAVAYLRGSHVTEDVAAAARWSAAAAHGGDPVGQYVLGTLYRQGAGVPADPVRAFDLFSAAAAGGNLKAMHNLGIAYAEGLGTGKDERKAAEWFARAAARGYVDSAFDLGVLHERGMGVTQDLSQAFKWYSVAALAGDAPARERAQFLKTQISAAQARAALSAAQDFAPLPPLEAANRLPSY